MAETVLCIKRQLLPESWVRQRSVVPLDLKSFVDQCTDAGFDFVDRPKAEKDPSFKQIIPYIVLQTSDLKITALYKRKGSEKRLHDLYSLGIGGHINPIDVENKNNSFEQIMIAGMERELSEELNQMPTMDKPVFMGVISEEITDVGKVHLGAVFRILTQTPEQYLPGEELFDFSWKKTDNLKHLNMELWSTLTLELISGFSD
ncbi:MAG: phosphoesterase [Pseudomonadota bacterium]